MILSRAAVARAQYDRWLLFPDQAGKLRRRYCERRHRPCMLRRIRNARIRRRLAACFARIDQQGDNYSFIQANAQQPVKHGLCALEKRGIRDDVEHGHFRTVLTPLVICQYSDRKGNPQAGLARDAGNMIFGAP